MSTRVSMYVYIVCVYVYFVRTLFSLKESFLIYITKGPIKWFPHSLFSQKMTFSPVNFASNR